MNNVNSYLTNSATFLIFATCFIGSLIVNSPFAQIPQFTKGVSQGEDVVVNESFVESSNLSRSINGAWQRLATDSKSSKNGSAHDRFLGFLEGRLSIRIPLAWEKSLRTTRFDGQNKAEFGDRREAVFDQTIGSNVKISNGFGLFDDGGWKLRGDGVAGIPLSGFDADNCVLKLGSSKFNCHFMCVAALREQQGVILGFPADSPMQYKVCRVDSLGNLVWESTIQCQRKQIPTTASIGFVSPLAEFANGTSDVFVFGIALGVAYIEAVDVESGGAVDSIFSSRDLEKQQQNKNKVPNKAK